MANAEPLQTSFRLRRGCATFQAACATFWNQVDISRLPQDDSHEHTLMVWLLASLRTHGIQSTMAWLASVPCGNRMLPGRISLPLLLLLLLTVLPPPRRGLGQCPTQDAVSGDLPWQVPMLTVSPRHEEEVVQLRTHGNLYSMRIVPCVQD